jgi:hypothetical protein
MPKPWGVTAVFAEHTGAQQPLDVDWSLERGVRTIASPHRPSSEPIVDEEVPLVAAESVPLDPPVDQALARGGQLEPPVEQPPTRVLPVTNQPVINVIQPPRAMAFATFWEFAVAVNRSDPAALALAGNGATADITMDGLELRKLLGMMWFRTVLTRLSADWRDRILAVLIESVTVPDHIVKVNRQPMHLRELSHEQLQEIGARTMVPDWVRADLDLLITVGRFWGADAVKRLRFVEAPERRGPSMVENLLERLRG